MDHERRPTRPRAPHAIALLAAVTLAACGGGGGGTDVASAPAPTPAPAPAPVPTTTALSVKVIDGALRNALVCVDLNDDGACGEGEPQARTDAGGNATLDVPNAELGRRSVVAMVGTDAVDADFGPVTAPFVLSAPKDRASVVSPLTTLVDAHARATGADTASAETQLRERAGLGVSLFTDYTAAAAGDVAAGNAKTVARLVVLATQQQAAALAPVVGTPDIDGTPIARADLDRATSAAILGVLPVLAASVADPAVTGAADRDAALRAFAQRVVENDSPLTAESAASTIGIQKRLAQAPATGPVPGQADATFRMLRYVDAGNWYYRAQPRAAADSVPDAQGLVRFYELRRAAASGVVQEWGFGGSYARRGDLFWNGSTWTDCPLGARGTVTAPDASGRARYVFCGGYSSGTVQRAESPIAGRTLASVVQQIRQLPGGDGGVAFASFGPDNLAALGSGVFPEGARLAFQRTVETAVAPAYDPTAATLALVNADIAEGGDATGSGTPPCRSVTATTPLASYSSPATTLEQVIGRYRGTPCRFSPGTDSAGNASGPRNETWAFSTVNVGTVVPATDVRPAGTGTYYTRNREIRVAFGAPGEVTYYNCLTRTTGGSGRNCDVAGSGTYRIETLGDARVLALSTPPASSAALSYERILVERGGAVWFGYRNKPATADGARLNLVAANALLGQLGLPTIAP